MSERHLASRLERVPCNLCGADDATVICPARYDHAKYDDLEQIFKSSGDERLIDQLVRCNHCQFVYVNPRLRQEVIVNGYSSGSDELFVSQNAAREVTFHGCLSTLEAASGIRRGRILDVGTAGGAFLHVARQRGWTVAGCELNRWLCRWAKEQYGLELTPGTLMEMGAEAESFDVVTLWDVLEHTTDPQAVLRECHRIVKPGGVVAINYPDYGSFVAKVMGRRWVFLLSVHLSYYTRETMARALKACGFEPFYSKPHWQTLEVGYILTRMEAYVGAPAKLLGTVVRALRLGRLHIPYWMGQTLVLARKV